ncbi:MAG: LysM peptidoglycan-binding domain-containing protein, partial [Cyanobacteria bacterium P01_F01_bin.116]
MKRANSQEPKSEISHSCFPDMDAVNEQAPSGNAGRTKSAAMLGLALSFGASGVLFADSEATAAVGSFVTTKSAASSESPQLPSVLNNQLEQRSVIGQGLTVYHTVEQGDSLWQIAQEHQVELQDIKVANRISPEAPLQVGQVIKVPNEEHVKPTLVSLLPGVQRSSNEQPSLERLIAGIPNSGANSSLQQNESSLSKVDEPAAVVTTEELTGNVSLRSAGLISQSDGFQADLEQLASSNSQVASAPTKIDENISQTNLPIAVAAEETPEASLSVSLEADTVSVDTASAGYGIEVQPGDTVEDIAMSLGTTPEELAEVNELEDPDFIIAGETLAVPEEVSKDIAVAEAATSLAQTTPEIAATNGIGGFDGTRLSRLQSTVENRIDGNS